MCPLVRNGNKSGSRSAGRALLLHSWEGWQERQGGCQKRTVSPGALRTQEKQLSEMQCSSAEPNAGLSPSSSDSLYPLSLILFPFTQLPVVSPQEAS